MALCLAYEEQRVETHDTMKRGKDIRKMYQVCVIGVPGEEPEQYAEVVELEVPEGGFPLL